MPFCPQHLIWGTQLCTTSFWNSKWLVEPLLWREDGEKKSPVQGQIGISMSLPWKIESYCYINSKASQGGYWNSGLHTNNNEGWTNMGCMAGFVPRKKNKQTSEICWRTCWETYQLLEINCMVWWIQTQHVWIRWSSESVVQLKGRVQPPVPESRAWVKQGGGSMLVWGSKAARGVGSLHFIEGTMNSEVYEEILST